MITYKKLGKNGRLGNQLFQIASTIGIADKNGMDFCFPEWEYQKHFLNPLPKYEERNYQDISELDYGYSDITLRDGDYNLEGYFQSWKYFNDSKGKVRQYFAFQKPYYKGVAIHVRRGDYLNLQHIHPVLPVEYYTEAMKHFPGDSFTVFSNDIAWCKENIKGDKVGYYPTGKHDIHDLKAMAGHSKFIIANSSYSWWAAFLSDSMDVIAPKLYVHGETRDDRIPPWWIKI